MTNQNSQTDLLERLEDLMHQVAEVANSLQASIVMVTPAFDHDAQLAPDLRYLVGSFHPHPELKPEERKEITSNAHTLLEMLVEHETQPVAPFLKVLPGGRGD